jgi:hypothetical protein
LLELAPIPMVTFPRKSPGQFSPDFRGQRFPDLGGRLHSVCVLPLHRSAFVSARSRGPPWVAPRDLPAPV